MSESLEVTSLFDVQGKVALVTGAGSGLGRYIAHALAVNGAKVYAVGRRADALERTVQSCPKGKGSVIALTGDVSNKDTIKKLIGDYRQHEQKLDVLVNSAGILLKDPVTSHPDDANKLAESLFSPEYDDWQNVMGINVSSLYFMSTGFAPLLHAASLASPSSETAPRESPCIVNISSIAGLHNSRTAGAMSYQVSKSAVHHLTRCLATRFIPLRIRVNCLAPGLFPSEMTNADPRSIRQTHKEHFKAMPEGRAGAPPDIAGPVLMLASRAGAYMNANVLDVSGGRSLMVSGAIVPDA